MSSLKHTRKILPDTPSGVDAFNGKGHERTAEALADAIISFDGADHAIGLDGPWGSGKSSVVSIAEDILKSRPLASKSGRNFHFFTFDIWKSQGVAFRRSFLESFLQWGQHEFERSSGELKKIAEDVRGTNREIKTNTNPKLDLHGATVIFLLPFLPLFYFLMKSQYDTAAKSEDISFYSSSSFKVLAVYALATLAWPAYKWAKGRKTDSSSYLDHLSRTLLISTKQTSDQTVSQKIRETDPSDFEFRDTLRRTLLAMQSPTDRVVIILDNIDRLPADEVSEYWAAMRSIFSDDQQNLGSSKVNQRAEEMSVTAIVPYDRTLISDGRNNPSELNSNTDQSKGSPVKGEISSLTSRELFSKTFSEILYVSPPVLSNIREFFFSQMSKATQQDFDTHEKFKVYKVFVKIIKATQANGTPRQIRSFINDLTGIYYLHDGEFSLSTVAVFLAHRDAIQDNPYKLADPNFLDQELVDLASGENLVRDLAAIAFNVDAELAFQILLDERIKEAIISENGDDFQVLCKAHGFEDRILDIVSELSPEWASESSLHFAIWNTALATKTSSSAALQMSAEILCDHISRVDRIAIRRDADTYMSALEICSAPRKPQVIKWILSKLDIQKGYDDPFNKLRGNLANFTESLAKLFLKWRDQCITLNAEGDFLEGIREVVLPSSREFIFHFANALHDSPLSLSDFTTASLKDKSDEELSFEEIAIKESDIAPTALYALSEAECVSEGDFNAIFIRIGEEFKSGSVETADHSKSLLALMGDAWSYLSEDSLQSDTLASIFEENTFYEGLWKSGISPSDLEIAAPICSVISHWGGGNIPNPAVTQPNGQKPRKETKEFQKFKDLVTGSSELSAQQNEEVARLLKRAGRVTQWIAIAQQSKTPVVSGSALRKALENAPAANIPAPTFFESYAFLRQLLPSGARGKALSIYGAEYTTQDLASVSPHDIPVDLIKDTWSFARDEWVFLHDWICAELQGYEDDTWTQVLDRGEDSTQIDILVAVSSTSKIKIASPKFRELTVNRLSDIINGRRNVEGRPDEGDQLLECIAKAGHEDIFRTLRERLSSTNIQSIRVSEEYCPSVISKLIKSEESISREQKDSICRHLLAVALDARAEAVLDMFISLGRNDVRRYLEASNVSTSDRVKASFDSYGATVEDRNRRETLTALLFGRDRKNVWFPWLKASEGDK
ncbi:MAG: hypothetical protein CMP09_11475 [Yangia sp.]|nr:hypothetical protein [Salipiger sp.]